MNTPRLLHLALCLAGVLQVVDAPVLAEPHATAEEQPAESTVEQAATHDRGYVLVDRTADLGGNTSKPRADGVAVDKVILHFMSAVNVQPDDPFDIDANLAIFNQYGVSSHYVIGRDGTVYQAVADDRIAYHAGRPDPRYAKHPEFTNMNGRSIGIELLAVGSARDMTTGSAPMMSRDAYRDFVKNNPDAIGYTDEQYTALTALLRELTDRHAALELKRRHIRGHDEYAGSRKKDPGELFDWRRLIKSWEESTQ